MPTTSKPWTKRDLQTLRDLAQAGVSAAEIGLRLGRTETAVRTRAWKDGVSIGPTRLTWRDRDDDRLRTAVAASSTIAQVAAAMGRSESSVQMRMSRLGLSVRIGVGLTTMERERIRELAAAGWSTTRIARQVGTTVEAVVKFSSRASA